MAKIIAKNQMEALLDSSNDYFKKRNLKMARTTAQIALDFAKQSENESDIYNASLLLSTIYGTNGRYANDKSFFQKAHDYLEVAQKLKFEKTPSNRIAFRQTLGLLHFDEEAFQKSIVTIDQALKDAESVSSTNSTCQLLLNKSHAQLQIGTYETALNTALLAKQNIEYHSVKDLNILSDLLKILSLVYVKTNEFGKAIESAQKLLSVSKELGEVEKELIALNVIAIVSGVQGNFKIATQYFQEALEKGEKIGYKYYIAQCQINIGTIYAHLYNYEDALERYNLVLEEYHDVLDDQTKVAIFNNVGNIHYTTSKFELAKSFFEKALKIANEKEYKNEAALSRAQLGRTFTALNRLEDAAEYASKASELFENTPIANGAQINLLNLGNIFFIKGNTKKAIQLIDKGIQSAINLHDDVSQITGYKLLAKIYKSENNYEKAFEYLNQFSKLKEEFSSKQRSRQFMDLEIKNALKNKQKEIEQLTKENELQSQLLEKTDQIEIKNRELTSMNEDLRQFAYIASHDLKEPLRMISSYAQILLRLYGDKFDENAKSYFGYMTEGVTRMNGLLEDLLKYATVGRNEEEVEEIEMDYVVEICRVNLKVLIQEANAQIHYDNLPNVYATRTTIIQLMQNLISNAIKFRKEGTEPVIKISCKKSTEEHTFTVSDNGIGMEKEHLERIFVIFQRLHSRTTYEGSGIGLAICQKIVQRWGGRIWVTSDLGNGSSFHFTVPIKE